MTPAATTIRRMTRGDAALPETSAMELLRRYRVVCRGRLWNDRQRRARWRGRVFADRADDSGVVQQEIDDVLQLARPVGGEGVLHEARGQQKFAGRAGWRGRRQPFRRAGREDEVCKPCVLFRREAQPRLRRAGEGPAHEHAIQPVALAAGGHAIAGKSEEYGEDDEALTAIMERGEAGLRAARRDHTEIEALFGDVFFVN